VKAKARKGEHRNVSRKQLSRLDNILLKRKGSGMVIIQRKAHILEQEHFFNLQ